MHSIYLITNKITGKQYVGYTSQDLETRMIAHRAAANCNSMYFIHQSIRKYGWDNFTAEVLYTSEEGEHTLKVMESYFIKEYKTYGSSGYNMTPGGEGSGPCSEETAKKISDIKKGMEVPWLIGHKYNAGFFWINNGTESMRSYGVIPEGWTKGRINKPGPRLNGTNRPKFENGYKPSTKPRVPRTEEHIENISKSLQGNTRAAGNKNVVGRIWVNNGIKNLRVLPDNIPEGFNKGRLLTNSVI